MFNDLLALEKVPSKMETRSKTTSVSFHLQTDFGESRPRKKGNRMDSVKYQFVTEWSQVGNDKQFACLLWKIIENDKPGSVCIYMF